MCVALGVMATLGGGGCSSSNCGEVNCSGQDLIVSWKEGDVPPAASYRLWLNGVCEVVEPTPLAGGRLMVGLDKARYHLPGAGRAGGLPRIAV
jgi:hypothetical protein